MASLAELGEFSKYHNDNDYYWDAHREATGEELDLSHAPTVRWAKQRYSQAKGKKPGKAGSYRIYQGDHWATKQDDGVPQPSSRRKYVKSKKISKASGIPKKYMPFLKVGRRVRVGDPALQSRIDAYLHGLEASHYEGMARTVRGKMADGSPALWEDMRELARDLEGKSLMSADKGRSSRVLSRLEFPTPKVERPTRTIRMPPLRLNLGSGYVQGGGPLTGKQKAAIAGGAVGAGAGAYGLHRWSSKERK